METKNQEQSLPGPVRTKGMRKEHHGGKSEERSWLSWIVEEQLSLNERYLHLEQEEGE